MESTPIENRQSKIENLLVVGGSGHVGTLVLPVLQDRFNIRVFDRMPPANPEWDYHKGDVTDREALAAAAAGTDLLLYMAMGKSGSGSVFEPGPAFDVNVKGLHFALDAAAKAGVKRAVYTSSLSVHDGHDLRSGEFDSEEVPPEPRSVYGLTKWMGEEVCRYANRVHGLPVLALRLFLPVSEEEWAAKHDRYPVDTRTAAPDLARALESALLLEHDGFDIIHITGDTSGRAFHHEKAKRLLGWEPLKRE